MTATEAQIEVLKIELDAATYQCREVAQVFTKLYGQAPTREAADAIFNGPLGNEVVRMTEHCIYLQERLNAFTRIPA